MSRIVQGAREALTIAKGEADPNDYAVHIPDFTTACRDF